MTVDSKAAAPAKSSGLAYLFLTCTMLCFAGNAVIGRFAVGEISPMLLVTLRWTGTVLLLSLFAKGAVRRDWPVLRAHWRFLAAMGALGYTSFNALFYVAAHSTTAINLGIIQGAMPMFVLLGAFAAYRTKVTARQAAGAVVTVAGVVLVATGGSLHRLADLAFGQGDLLMIVACVLYAGYTVALRRRPAVSSFAMFAALATAALIASLPLLAAEIATGRLQTPTARGWLVVAFVSVFPSIVAQVCYMRGVELIGPGRAGIFTNLVPVFVPVLAVALLGESFEAFHAAALCLVLGGIWLSERGRPGAG
jgi:drug/metabolite transporter (DMT)-like permease